MANGYAALSERDLEACILAAACAGGGAITNSTVDASGTPTSGQKIWVNTATNHAWVSNGTTWQILLG